ncbi:hypothetical protein SAMN05216570_3071 [Dyella sp. OK004]|uniref:hypothetical protein n=1 Tax=Dyella sp. OK004 TaxID=1855292 RepID=UPI0008E4B7F2|nr:hypothetical protein [Dyella sp. OK004]SFS14360.1 hypothetical protein SAMN05216570_3071 [Dyella sp. OK004]
MSSFPGSPRLLKGGIVLLDAASGAVQRVIALQYNPDSVSRTLQVQGAGDGADHSEALRLKGPPIETIKLEAELDLTDQLEFPDQNQIAVQSGLAPQLAALEIIVYPTSARLEANYTLAQQGALEIIPAEAPMTLFIWSSNRVLPMRITEFSITEEAFDTALNPIRAKISLGMRVLSVTDLGFDHRGGGLYMVFQRQKERLATQGPAGTLNMLGGGGLV